MPFFAALWANPLVRKIALYVGIALAALWLMRMYGNSRYAAGQDDERKNTAKEVLKAQTEAKEQVEKEWAARLPEFDKLGADLAKNRAAIKKDLSSIIANHEQERNQIRSDVALIPSGKVGAEMLKAMKELRQ